MSRKGRGWHRHPREHGLASKGIKTVSLTKSQRMYVARSLQPLLAKKIISGYSLVEKPDTIKSSDKQVLYTHNVIKRHRNVIVEELKDLGMKYEIVPEEEYGGNRARKEYEIVASGTKDQVFELTRFLKRRTTDFNELIQFVDTQLNPAESGLNAIALNKARVVPDIKVRNERKLKDFAKATRISKNIDSDTELVIITIRPANTKAVRQALKGEQATEILVQDFIPERHSLKNQILNKTKPAE